MIDDEIRERIQKWAQPHLLSGLETLSFAQKQQFLVQLKRYDEYLLENQRRALRKKKSLTGMLSPLEHYEVSGSQERILLGKNLMRDGKVACVILAGGLASRLGSSLPKGLYKISQIKQKTLFQIFFEKALAASQWSQRELPIAVMTSPANHTLTVDFLRDHHWFGLSEKSVDFFMQDQLPFLDEEGNWVLQEPGLIAEGPDGNGNFFNSLNKQGILSKWQQFGVEYIHVILIDNPLADPFDAELSGLLHLSQAEVGIKCVPRLHEKEKVGVLGKTSQGKIKVIEYLELDKEYCIKREDGSLKYPLANVSLFAFSLNFLKRISENSAISMPWHAVRKKAQIYRNNMKNRLLAASALPQNFCQERATIAQGQGASEDKNFEESPCRIPDSSCSFGIEIKEIWKFETFIFDMLDATDRVSVICYPRSQTFAPLKNLFGEDSLETVQRALLSRDREIFEQITGTRPPEDRVFELAPAFYYPSDVFLKKWKGRGLPEKDYIE